jgi:hypothetical protein
MIGGIEADIGSAFKGMLDALVGALQRFFNEVSRFFDMIYYAIPRPYVVGGLTILVLGIALMYFISRPRV